MTDTNSECANGCSEVHEIIVGESDDKARLDSFLVRQFGQLSRAKIQRSINQGGARVNGEICKSSYRLSTGQKVLFELPPVDSEFPVPEEIPLDVIYEDEHLIGINKPPRMVVHPAKGHWSGTLTAALAFHFSNLSTIGGASRPGIVHRLDRDTSGIIVIAKTDRAHSKLSKQFEKRTVVKQYVAIVAPRPDRDRDHIDKPIGIHPYQREKMAIRKDHKSSRQASTFYEVVESVGRFAKVVVMPKTGRTHQIRVHLASIGSPVVADKLYSGRSQLRCSDIDRQDSDEVILDRQALHASSITIRHPENGSDFTLQAPLANDIQSAWESIQRSSDKP